MKRLRELDDYERETLFRLVVIALGLIAVVVLFVVASMLQSPTRAVVYERIYVVDFSVYENQVIAYVYPNMTNPRYIPYESDVPISVETWFKVGLVDGVIVSAEIIPHMSLWTYVVRNGSAGL